MGARSDVRAVGLCMTERADFDRLAVLTHEVRSPVAALASIAHVYGDGSVDSSQRRSLAGLAIAACRGIERVVADAAVSSIRLEGVDLGRIAREAAAAAELLGAPVRVVAGGPARVRADPVRVRQVLDNLVANAIHSSRGTGEPVALIVEQAADEFRVSVSDRGPGIATEDQERIFEPGVRLADDYPGSGLGLALGRAIAVAHGGTLTVRSALGAGATFTLALPASPSS
jgi:two-component system, OmpR family, sensor kinase